MSTAAVVRYWLACDFHRERRIRAVLSSFHTAGGQLQPGIVDHLAGRRINQIKPSQPNKPYSAAEWERLAQACNTMIKSANTDHRRAVEASERGMESSDASLSEERLAWIIRSSGPLAIRSLMELFPTATVETHQLVVSLRRSLFPDQDVAFAYNLLFAIRTGIVPDGIDALLTGDVTRTGPSSILLSYMKGRTGKESLVLSRAAVRVLDQWLEHSALLRGHAGDQGSQLWLGTNQRTKEGGRTIFTTPRTQYRRRVWAQRAGLIDDDGGRLQIHGGRVRATFHHLKDRSAWTGRTTIDPNHSAKVEADHYLSSHTPAQKDAIEGIIEDAQTDIRRKAAPPLVTNERDAAKFAQQFPNLVQEAELDLPAVQKLLDAEQDVFVAACASPMKSPYAPVGKLCPARPWVCLLCPLAVFTARHLPNLLGLKEYFSAQAAQLPLPQFMGVFGPYAARLDEEILPRFSTWEIAAAAGNHQTLPLTLEEQGCY
ncbi:hypothetical protein IV500_17530 [Paeniglutamicibacter antarcticus]|uniref:Uncharacterized protein n=1 Tax=Arthrobacter terrae TaxID=2935737 RepID=A0A931CWF9_9MICC|nr:hypothetical protein [Arthrobacter terrae]MBG0741173.1 hypothetical protein [Arthrobacter terrae]